MPVKLRGATSGDITLDVPAVAGSNTLTLPAKTGNIITSADSGTVSQTMLAANVAGNGPAFYAYSDNTGSSVANGVWHKLLFPNEGFDTNNCFASSRFTPNVAGYYQINASVGFVPALSTNVALSIYKNGTELLRGAQLASLMFGMSMSGLVSMNGTTDYIEIYIYNGTGGTATVGNFTGSTFVTGFLARAA